MISYLEKSEFFPNGNSEVKDISTENVVNIFMTRFFLVSFRFGKFKQKFDEYKYLEDRCKLFLKVCYPSVIQNFSPSDKWYLLVSEPFINFVKEQLGQIDSRVIVCDVNKAAFSNEIKGLISSGKLPCVTRIDNDDTISADYVPLMNKVCKRLSERIDFSFVSFPFGLQLELDTNDCSVILNNTSHTITAFFNSISLPIDDLWIYDFDHTKMFEYNFSFIVANTTLPMWSENITGLNQGNSKRNLAFKINLQQSLLKVLFRSLF